MKSTLDELEILIKNWFFETYGEKHCMHFDNLFDITMFGSYNDKSICIVDQVGDVCDLTIRGANWDDVSGALMDHINLET